MARKRMLSPEMFSSRSVCSWPVPTRWTWAGVLTYLDDYGYGEDSAALVKAAVYPRDDYTTKKVAADLDKIEDAGSLCRFECCDRKHIHAPQWSDWQSVAHPGKFRFCPCPEHDPPAHELHLKASGDPREDFNPSLVEVSSVERSSSEDDKVPLHPFAKCPDPKRHNLHRGIA